MRIEPTNPLSASSGPTTARTTAPPPGWDPALLKEIEGHLARFLGPVAKVLVRRAGRGTLDVDQLYAQLSEKLESEDERDAFMATRRRLAGAPHGSTIRPATQGEPALTPEKVDAAARTLAIYIGPIAKVMAKKAAAQTSSVQRFYLLLAESLPESERKRFLDTVAPASPSRERR